MHQNAPHRGSEVSPSPCGPEAPDASSPPPRPGTPRLDRPYTDLLDQPMLELLASLRANGFKTYAVSGGGIESMRTWIESGGPPPRRGR